ncbi:MAG: serine--tRNA ligase [bacterium]|nr:serine--tRNA ligase [bacterium]
MLDIKFIREKTSCVKKAVKNRNMSVDIDEILAIDKARRLLLGEAEILKQRRNLASSEIPRLEKEGKSADAYKATIRVISQKIKELDGKLGGIDKKLHQKLLFVPNIPHKTTPIGKSEKDNVEIKKWGGIPKFTFAPKTHWEIAKRLDILDFERASKITGSHFCLYKGSGARLERALINFMLDIHTKKHGYKEISTPFIANRLSMTGTGQLPKMEEDMYRCEIDDFFLIPTAEVPVTNIHRDEILKEDDLPICYTAYSPCFRREAGSYGKDTRGLNRVHQFDKVEMVKFVNPENSYDELESLLKNAETILRELELPYRVIVLNTTDISFAAAKCYDIEVWGAGQNKYFEVSSCSNFEDFQARRANIRFRRKQTEKVEFVHTLNGSGVALARTVVALLENNQREDGSVSIPKALQPYMDGMEVIE